MIDLTSLNDNALVDWSKNFAGKIGEYASLVGLSASDEHRINEDSAATTTLVDTTNQAKEARSAPSLMDELVGFKNSILNGPAESLRKAFPAVFAGLGTRAAVGILPRMMSLVDNVRKNPGLTPAIAQSLGLDDATLQKLKGSDNEMLAWLGNFVDKLKGHRTELGLHETEVQAANSDVNALQHVVQQTDKAQSEAPNHPQLPNLLKYKELIANGPGGALTKAFPAIAPTVLAAVPGILPRFTDYVQRIMHSGKYDANIGSALGLNEPKETPAMAHETVEKREPVAAATPRPAPQPAMTRPTEHHGGFPGWLLPLILLALLGLITYSFWPKKTHVARGVPPGAAPVPVSTPVPVQVPVSSGPLTISNVKVTPESNGTLVTWNTNRPATGQIEYGRSNKLEMGISPKAVSTDPHNYVMTHTLKLLGLHHAAHYFYRVVSKDKNGNAVMTKVESFKAP